jgi:hypothetical protein
MTHEWVWPLCALLTNIVQALVIRLIQKEATEMRERLLKVAVAYNQLSDSVLAARGVWKHEDGRVLTIVDGVARVEQRVH